MHEDEESGSDSEPEVDEMNAKEQQVFINPATASKIGIKEVKIVEKSTRKRDQDKKELSPAKSREVNLRDLEFPEEEPQANMDTILNQRFLRSEMFKQEPKAREDDEHKIEAFRATRSVTKI